MKKTILVTGASGMVGSHLVQELIGHGFHVVGLDRAEGRCEAPEYEHLCVDLGRADAVDAVFRKHPVDRVIHLAALAHTEGEKDLSAERYYHINVKCAEHVFSSAAVRKIPILFISTVDVYGFAKDPVTPCSRRDPVSLYARTKAMAEDRLVRICREEQSLCTVFRLSPVYTEEVKRDIQKRYYLKYPDLAYLVGGGSEFEVLNIRNAVAEMREWCSREPVRECRILKDPEPLRTREIIEEEKKAGRAGKVLHFPLFVVQAGSLALQILTGKNPGTYLLHKAAFPLRSGETKPKVLFISSSGGHYEQLKMLKPQMNRYDSRVITEKMLSAGKADYYMIQISHTDKGILFKFACDMAKAIRIWIKEKPEYIVSTGSMIVLPFAILAKLTGKKIIFIETFAKLDDPTLTGKLLYKWADLFIIQWESLRKCYPDAVYGGSIY